MKKVIQFGENVEGYKIPVLNEREIRASAGILFLGLIISLMQILYKSDFLMVKYFITIFLTDFAIRVFINPKYSPTLIIGRIAVRNQTPEYVGAAQKKVAWSIGLFLSATMFIFMVIVNSYSPITGIICLVCLIFTFFESVFGICLACKFYKLIYKDQAQYCPERYAISSQNRIFKKYPRHRCLLYLGLQHSLFLRAYCLMAILAGSPVTCLDLTVPPRLKSSDTMHFTLTDHPEIMAPKVTLEKWFSRFRKNIIGLHQFFETPFGEKQILYADWTATGRAYQPIEDCLQKEILPFVGNTHTSTTITGTLMSRAYEEAKSIIKEHVCADTDDVLLFCGSGMTAAVNKLQRILGLRLPERFTDFAKKGTFEIDDSLRPVVFVTHMEHHSNHISWLETIATVEIIQPDDNGIVDLAHFRALLEKFKHRKNKIAAITACSNVTGIETPYHNIARMIHEYGGLCFVDFAGSAPYVDMNMHPAAPGEHLDAVYFSPHKFLGGPGTPGVLIFNKKLYKNSIPDQPGGGTIAYSNPWKVHKYITDIEQREDGGTPSFLQGIKAAMCIRLKEAMGIENIQQREEEILRTISDRFSKMKNVKVIEGHIKKRLGVISFIADGAHHDLFVRILNDRFGIQTRGGCSCAGTYGHHLLQVDEARSHQIMNSILSGDLLSKPGWIRLSIHPTMTNAEVHFMMDAIELTASRFEEWTSDYVYHHDTDAYRFKGADTTVPERIEGWFDARIW